MKKATLCIWKNEKATACIVTRLKNKHHLYKRRGRQMCTLRHVMPLYNVHTLSAICVISPIG
ncbi:hypothetical protein SFRURICE_007500 [Spodoptera frugiperda]|nr:hypothetical protein SFRURICE_007500 [Spodoptera frugiperda]